MLILTRRVSETIVIAMPDGTEINVTVLGVNGQQSRIGIDAPKEVVVDRKEIFDRKQAGIPKPAPRGMEVLTRCPRADEPWTR